MSPGGHGGGGHGGWGHGDPGSPGAGGPGAGGWGAGPAGPGPAGPGPAPSPYGPPGAMPHAPMPHAPMPHGGTPYGAMPHVGMPGYHAGFGGHGTHHEFGPTENATIGSAATWAKALGVVGFVDVGLEALNLNVVGAIIAFVIALAFWKAGSSLSSVVTTQGHDVPHLMQAVQQIGSAFHTRTIVTLIGAGLVLLAGLGFVAIAIIAATR